MRLADKVVRDWYLEYLIARGMSIEYWDISELLRGKFDEHHELITSYLQHIDTYSELERRLTLPENAGVVFVIMIGLEARFLRLFKLLCRYQCKTVGFAWGAMPESTPSRGGQLQMLLTNPLKFMSKLASRLQLMTAKMMGQIKPLDVVFTAGQVMAKRFSGAPRLVPVNLCDYDNFVRLAATDRLSDSRRYAVFLDTNLPYQSDLPLVGLRPLRPDRYFSSLNRFFSALEERFNLKVVIAAHPKSNYAPELFNFREAKRHVTPELVRDADFVITQTSTALSYAVLNLKPVVFVYTDEFLDIYADSLMLELQAFSSYIGSALVNIDNPASVAALEIPKVMHENYKRYRYDFLTSSESQHRTTQEIFFETLKAL